MRRALAALAALALTALAAPWRAAAGDDGAPPTPAEARRRWEERLNGRHFVATVTLSYHFGRKLETRTMSVWRDSHETGERLMARFESPADLRGFGLLYLSKAGQPNDYFIYQPGTRRVRRISDKTASQDIYGVDLEFLGFGVAQAQPTDPRALVRDQLDGREVYRLEERATVSQQRFDRRVAYLDAASFLPLRVEHYREGSLVLVATTEEIATVQGVLTPIRTRFARPAESSEVGMVVDSIDYERPIPGLFFSTLSLVKP